MLRRQVLTGSRYSRRGCNVGCGAMRGTAAQKSLKLINAANQDHEDLQANC
jgi:hypothetical protein